MRFEVGRELLDSPLQGLLASQRLFEIDPVPLGGVAGNFGVSAGGLLALFQLGDSAAEEIIDDFELADARLEVAAVG